MVAQPVDSRSGPVYPAAVPYAIWLMVGGLFGLACGLLAVRRNRSSALWFMLGLASGPIALVALLVMSRRERPAFL